MESFRLGGVLKVDRPAKKSDGSSSHLRKVAKLLRVLELFVLMVVISKFSVQLPEAVKSSGEYFRELKLVVLSPRFIFVLGNAIVVTLFVKSGRFSARDSGPSNDFYSEFVEKSERLNHHGVRQHRQPDYQDKQVIFEKVVRSEQPYRKSQSLEKLDVGQDEKPKGELMRRSSTEKCVKKLRCGEKLSIEGPFPEDSMSNDEFRKTVDAFIARHQRFLRDEEFCTM